MGWRAFVVAAPSVWNSLSDYLRDAALELNGFRRQLERIGDILIMRYVNVLFTYLLIYLLSKVIGHRMTKYISL